MSVEAVILVPLFLVVLFTILQASLWVHASAVAQAAAQDGVRAGTAVGGSAVAGSTVAESILAQRTVGEGWVVTTESTGTGLTIAIVGQSTTIVPGLVLTVRESATLPWEGR